MENVKELDAKYEISKLVAAACKDVRESMEREGIIPDKVQSVAALIKSSEQFL